MSSPQPLSTEVVVGAGGEAVVSRTVGGMPRRAPWDRAAVAELAERQHGMLTARQLAAFGVPNSTIHQPDDVGSMFSLVLPGVHRLGRQRQLSQEESNCAALLYAGASAVLTGRSMLLRHDVRAAREPAIRPVDRVHVLVPHERQRASHGFVMVERTWRFPAAVRVWNGLPEAPFERAVMDACRRCSTYDAVLAVMAEAVQRGHTTVERLAEEIAACQRRGTRFPRRVLSELASGVRSVPEGRLRDGMLGRGLAAVLFNPWLYTPDGELLCHPDAYERETGTIAEVDSQEHHLAPADWKHTMARHARVTSYGLALLHFPPSRFLSDIDGCLDEFVRTVERRRGIPRPEVVILDAERRLVS